MRNPINVLKSLEEKATVTDYKYERLYRNLYNHAFCSEYLFKDWESFLDLLYAEGGRISSILWWDHCTKKQLHESVGSGGYKDPENNEFVYAETQLYKEGLLEGVRELKTGKLLKMRYKRNGT